jgi:hypothetical protein
MALVAGTMGAADSAKHLFPSDVVVSICSSSAWSLGGAER